MRRRRKIVIPLSDKYKDKNTQYVTDHKSGERIIVTNSPFCRFCFKEYNDGDYAYFASGDHFIVCKDCLTAEGVVGVYFDIRNQGGYLLGKIRIKTVEVREE